MTARRLATLLVLPLTMLAGVAFASIGGAPSTILDALAAYEPAAQDGGGYRAASDFTFRIHESLKIATSIDGEGSLNDANVRFVADLIGAASGYGDAIAGPAAEFFRTRAGDLAGQGEAAIGVEEYALRITVTGDAPYHLVFSLAPMQVDPASFPPPTHVLGPADAKHVIREFSDFQCPFCARFASDVFPQLEQQVLAAGDVRFEFHHFPLKSIHPNAVVGAEAAECVAAANGDPPLDGTVEDGAVSPFWTYHDALFARQADWTGIPDPTDALVNLAETVGLSTDGVASCIRSGTYSSTIETAYQAAVTDLQLTGTPTLFVDGLKVGDYTDLDTYARLMTLWDAIQAEAGAGAGTGE